jgi:hypothetical protein
LIADTNLQKISGMIAINVAVAASKYSISGYLPPSETSYVCMLLADWRKIRIFAV